MTDNGSFTFAILGAGGRGQHLGNWIAEHPDAGRVVAVAEPLPERRSAVAERHGLAEDMQCETWQDLLERPKLADALLNTTMDLDHVGSSAKALDLGYHMLLEKPMATTLDDCIAIDQARQRNNRIVAICHNQRHHRIYAELKHLLDEGAIGRLMTFDQLEGVGHLHMSHSFVRGNWGNESRSTFMLLAKSCHDLDILAYLVGRPCRRVSSFGNLTYFRPENAPPGAPPRCTDGCPHETDCTYSALRMYIHEQDQHWFAGHAGMLDKSPQDQLDMLRTGPYGRCAWQCDNDVVDHQVVNFEFDDDVTGTFTMTGFTAGGMDSRHIRLHGTEGCLKAHIGGNVIDCWRFKDDAHTRLEVAEQTGGHGGADSNIMANFVEALRRNDPDHVLTGTAESLQSHALVFAAEKSRRERRMVELEEFNTTD
jgi:predicted dehydrogenase